MNSLQLSPLTQRFLIGIGALVFLCIAFTGGIVIGERKSRHLSRWCDNYNKQFSKSRGPVFTPMHDPRPAFLPNEHAVFGRVVSVSGTVFFVQGVHNVERQIITDEMTAVRRGWQEGVLMDVVPDIDVGVFGVPLSDGALRAKLIRIGTP